MDFALTPVIKFIETVPRRGYRFVAGVRELNDGNGAPVTSVPRAPATPNIDLLTIEPVSVAGLRPRRKISPKILLGVFGLLALTLAGVGLYLYFRPAPRAESLAILPFSAAPETEYLAGGITESLINNLSRLSNLRVTARATAFSYKRKDANPIQVGQELKVGMVLTGRVALHDGSLTVQVDLVDAAVAGTKRRTPLAENP